MSEATKLSYFAVFLGTSVFYDFDENANIWYSNFRY